MSRVNTDGELVGHSGMTVKEWNDWHVSEYLAGRRDPNGVPWEFEREFVADADGYVQIEKVCNHVTGEWITLDPPRRMHLDELDRFLAEQRARFEAEWEAGAAERAERARHWPNLP